MQRIKQLFSGEDRAVSPVIGVILMVAITVILAAVIASFVLGLGDSAAEPSPNPTIQSDHSAQELELSVTGGDDFDAGVAEVQYEINVTNFDTEQSKDVEGSVAISEGDVLDNGDNIDNLDSVDYAASISGDEVTAGDSMAISLDLADENANVEIVEWEVDIVWNPADADSDIIYSDSS